MKKLKLINIYEKNEDMEKIFTDSDILYAMIAFLDEEPIIYTSNVHYAIGVYYDITKVSSVFGDKDYNSQSNIDAAKETIAAEKFMNNVDNFDDYQQNAIWMKEF